MEQLARLVALLAFLAAVAASPIRKEEESKPAQFVHYHTQDATGQYSYGYSYPGQAHTEKRSRSGEVQGQYSYTDPNGKLVQVYYLADENGFRASGNNFPQRVIDGMPQQVTDVPEVKLARERHLQAHSLMLAKINALKLQQKQDGRGENPIGPAQPSGVVVEDTDAYRITAADDVPLPLSVYPKLSPNIPYDPNSVVHEDVDSVMIVGDNSPTQDDPATVHNAYFNRIYGPAIQPRPDDPVSLKAVYHQSIPVAAVHDVQVAPHQEGAVRNHQLAQIYHAEPNPVVAYQPGAVHHYSHSTAFVDPESGIVYLIKK